MQQLRRNALTAVDSTLISVSSAAPANGFATNTVALIGAVGLSGPGALIFGAVPMFGIALAYFYLNAWRSDAGAAYSWVGRALNPMLGFFAGWALILACLLFLVVGSLPLASATLDLVAPTLVSNVLAVTGVGLAWLAVVVAIVLLGIKATAEVQKALTIFQIGSLATFIGFALAKGIPSPVNHLSASWFAPYSGGLHNYWAGALVAIFYLWGWDVSSNLTEETIDRRRTPGLSGIMGMLIILTLFIMSQISAQMTMSTDAISAANSNVLVAFVDTVMPRPWNALAIFVILFSTIAVLEITLVQSGRTMFSMGRDRVLDERFAKLHPRFLTPWNATFALAIVAVVLFAIAATSPSVNLILKDMINATGVLVAVYYGLSGIACAAYYRTANRQDRLLFWLRGGWPVVAALFVFIVACAQLETASLRADLSVLGLLFVGIVPMWYYRRRYASSFYTQPREYATLEGPLEKPVPVTLQSVQSPP
jgi:amino acid transporter